MLWVVNVSGTLFGPWSSRDVAKQWIEDFIKNPTDRVSASVIPMITPWSEKEKPTGCPGCSHG